MAVEGILIDLSESVEEVDTPGVISANDVPISSDPELGRINDEIEANLSQMRLQQQQPEHFEGRSLELRKMDSCANVGNIIDEEFDFDCVLSPERQTADIDDEVFFGPVGFTERISSIKSKTRDDTPIDAPLSHEQIARIFMEANTIACRIEMASNKIYRPEIALFDASLQNNTTKNDAEEKQLAESSPKSTSANCEKTVDASRANDVVNESAQPNQSISRDKPDGDNSLAERHKESNKENVSGKPVKRSGTFKIPRNGQMSIQNREKSKVATVTENPHVTAATDVAKPITKRRSLPFSRPSDDNAAVPKEKNVKLQRNKFGGSLRSSCNTATGKFKTTVDAGLTSKDDMYVDVNVATDNTMAEPPQTAAVTSLATDKGYNKPVGAIKPMIKKVLGNLPFGQRPPKVVKDPAKIGTGGALQKKNSPVLGGGNNSVPKLKAGQPVKAVQPMKVVQPMKAGQPVKNGQPIKAVQPFKAVQPVKAVQPLKAASDFSLNESDARLGHGMSTPVGRVRPAAAAPKRANVSATNARRSLAGTPVMSHRSGRSSSQTTTDVSTTFDSPPNLRDMVASSTPASAMIPLRRSFLPTPNGSVASSRKASSVSSAASDDVFDKTGMSTSGNIARLISFDACESPKSKSKQIKRLVKKVAK